MSNHPKSGVDMDKDVADNLKRFVDGTSQGKPTPKRKIVDDQIDEGGFFDNQETIGAMPNIEDGDDGEDGDAEEESIIEHPYAYQKSNNEGFVAPDTQKTFKDRKPTSDNPLSAYFREPGIYVRLPSQGNYNTSEVIDFSVAGEVGVFPMTAKDEIWFKNPDALLNGEAVEKVLLSCCPGIKSIRNLPINDVNVLLLALRHTSYGRKLHLATQCPKCNEKNDFNVDIEEVLSEISLLEPNYEIKLDNGMLLNVKPYTYDSTIKATIVTFEEARIIQLHQKDDIPEADRKEAIRSSFERINNVSMYLLARSIETITMPDEVEVTETDFIEEWITQIDRQTYSIIKAKVDEINNIGVPNNWHHTCSNEKCKNEFPVEISYDPSTFFE